MAVLPVQVVVNHRCLLGEGVVWDEEQEVVSWLDIEKGEIHEYSFKQAEHRMIKVHQKIGSIAHRLDGNYVAAMEDGIGFVDRTTGEIRMIVNPESDKPNNRSNDGKCDPAGRFWFGTMSLLEEPGAGSLYTIDEQFEVTKKIENTTISNGLTWDTARCKFYHIDTLTSTVSSYEYDVETGQITNKEIVIRIPKDEGFPDGMTIDSEGMLWIAQWDGWQIARWNPLNGKKLFKIELPVSRPSCCSFGGKDMNNLFITSAKIGLSKEDLSNQPLAGSLFLIQDLGFEGIPAFKFKGKI